MSGYRNRLEKLMNVYKEECLDFMTKLKGKVLDKKGVSSFEEITVHSVWLEEELGDLKSIYGINFYLIDGIIYIEKDNTLYIPLNSLLLNGKTLDEINFTELSKADNDYVFKWLETVREMVFSLVGDFDKIPNKKLEGIYREYYLLYTSVLRSKL